MVLDELFTQSASQQEEGAVDANSVKKMSIVKELTVTDVYYSSLHDKRFMSQANLIAMQRFSFEWGCQVSRTRLFCEARDERKGVKRGDGKE